MRDALDLTRRLVAPLTRTTVFRRYAPRVLPVLERWISRISGGRLQLAGLLVPALELHTVGAKSGVTRVSRLMYTPDGPGCAIVAGSNFGLPAVAGGQTQCADGGPASLGPTRAQTGHPGWTTNLRAHPDAEIVVQGRTIAVRATEIGDDERDAVWARIEAQWPGYRGYERVSGRTVRLFRLRAVPSAQVNTPSGATAPDSTASGSAPSTLSSSSP